MVYDIIMWCIFSFLPVDGGWSSWTNWSPCSRTCGGGSQYRSRLCDSPKPQHNGQPCTGDGMETRQCNNKKCPGGRINQCSLLVGYPRRPYRGDGEEDRKKKKILKQGIPSFMPKFWGSLKLLYRVFHRFVPIFSSLKVHWLLKIQFFKLTCILGRTYSVERSIHLIEEHWLLIVF